MSCYRLLSSIILATFLVACANVSHKQEASKPTVSNKKTEHDRQANNPKQKPALSNGKTTNKVKVRRLEKTVGTSTDESESQGYVGQEINMSTDEEEKISTAEIIFLRGSVVASAVEAYLYELREEHLYLVSVVDNNTQVRHRVAPGEYTYMLLSGSSADFIQVDAKGGYEYFTRVKPHMGAWKPSFSLWPVKHVADGVQPVQEGQQDLESLLANTAVFVEGSSDLAVVDPEIVKILDKNWSQWNQLDETARQLKTLNREDGHQPENLGNTH